jgi:hypothetical protein
MSAFTIIKVPILRAGKQTKTTTGGYTNDGPVPLAGSPFPCRFYSKRQAFSQSVRNESEQGISNVDIQYTLSIEAPGVDVRVGDIAVLPAGTVNAAMPTRAKIVRPRFYERCVQCDIETGAE